MLDNRADRLIKFLRHIPSGLQVDNVVIGEFLTLPLACIGNTRARSIRIHGSFLVRVLAIAQVHDFVEGKPQRFGESFLGSVQLKSSVRAHTLKRGSDSGIVRRRGGKSLLSEPPDRKSV